MNRTRSGKTPRRRRAGFTLIELLAVIIILAIVAGFVIGAATFASRRSDISRTTADLEMLKQGLDEYRARYGSLPLFTNVPYHRVTGTWGAPDHVSTFFNAHVFRTDYDGNVLVDSGTGIVHALWSYPQVNDNYAPFIRVPELTDPTKVVGLKDAWGNSYQYYHDHSFPHSSTNDPYARFSYDLWSFGPTIRTQHLAAGTWHMSADDDLTNWRGNQ